MRDRTFFEQQLEKNPAVLLVCYEEAVSHPQEEFSRICRFLGLDFSPGMTDKVFASSVGKCDFPKIAQPVEELCDGMLERLDQVRLAAEPPPHPSGPGPSNTGLQPSV
jgi:hypothetical protein